MDVKETAKLLDEATLKALKNREFKERFLKDANKAIKQEYNKDLPVKVTVHEPSEKHVYFVLPPEEVELNEDALETVSGGAVGVDLAGVWELSIQVQTCYGCFQPGVNLNRSIFDAKAIPLSNK